MILLLRSRCALPDAEEATFGAKKQLSVLELFCWRPGSAFTHHPWGLRRGQWHSGLPKQLLLCSALFSLTQGMGPSLREGRAMEGTLQFFIPQLSVVQQTRCQQPGSVQYHDSGAAGLEGEPKKL